MEFLDLDSTIGLEQPSYKDLNFFSLALSDYNLTTFDAQSLSVLKDKIQSDQNLGVKYAVAKLGFDPEDDSQFKQGIALLQDTALIDED